MTTKDEIRSLQVKIDGLKYEIKQLKDYKEENIRLQNSLKNSKSNIDNIKQDKDQLENNISTVFNSFKTLISRRSNENKALKSINSKEITDRMRKDNKIFEESIYEIENKTKNILDELYTKVKQYCSSLSSGKDNNNIKIDVEKIKFNLQNILNEFNLVFNEIQNILNLSSQYIAEEEEETLRNITMTEIIIEEVERLLRFVPNNEIIRNNILGQLGINPNNFPLNTPTIRIILTNFQEVKRKRQTQLRSILDEIKAKSRNILTKKTEIENEINKAIKEISPEQNQQNEGQNKSLSIENIFSYANKINQDNIKDFKYNVVDKINKEIQEFEDLKTAESFQEEDNLTSVKSEFAKNWTKMKNEGCESLFDSVKKESGIYFEPFLVKYQKYSEIINVFRDIYCSPESEIIKQGLLNCTDTIDKVKKDITPIKCVILLGKKNKNLETLNETLVKNLPFIIYYDYKTINDIYYDLENNIKKITCAPVFDLVFPIIVAYYNNYEEFEKENNMIEKLIVNCLKKKVGFLFFFNITKNKELGTINKKIKSFMDKNEIIKKAVKDSGYEISQNLGCNMTSIEFGAKVEMEKLTKFKKDLRVKINKTELKEEYFYKMWDVYNSHSISSDLLGIQNAQDESTSRERLLNSIIDYSLICVNLDKKPKTKQLKDKELQALNQKIKDILDNIYTQNFMEDYKKFINNLTLEKTFILYLSREKLMADLDIKYNTSLLTEETDPSKTKNIIYSEIEEIIDKKYKKEIFKYIGKIIWVAFFDRFCPSFPKLFQIGFQIPDDFDTYLRESLNK